MLERIPLDYYIFSGLFNFIASVVLSSLVFLKNPKSRVNQTFSLTSLVVAGWGLFYFLWLSTADSSQAEFYLRTLMICVIFIPPTLTHFLLTFLKREELKKRVYVVNYLISLFLGSMVYTEWFARDIGPYLLFPYWLKPGPLFHLHVLHLLANIVFSQFLMLRAIQHHAGVLRSQILYVFLGMSIGYIAGITNYLTWYRLSVPPFLNPLVSLYVVFIAYAIIRHRLMDISIVINKGAAYGLLLGTVLIPTYLAVTLSQRATFYSIPPLLAGTIIFACGLWIVLKNPRSTPNITFGLTCLGVCIWLFGMFMTYSTTDEAKAVFWGKFAFNAGIVYIPAFVYHFCTSFLRHQVDKRKILAHYLIGTFFFLLLPTSYFINGQYSYFWGYYPKAGLLHPLFLLYFFPVSGVALGKLYRGYKAKERSDPFEAVRLKYVFWAFVIGYIATIDKIQLYGYEVYPTGFIFVTLWTLIMTYAIAKHRVMDITLVVNRATLLPYGQALLLIGFYFLILGVIRMVTGTVEHLLAGALVALFLLLAGIVHHAKEGVERAIDQALFRQGDRPAEILREFGRMMVTILDPDRLGRKMVEALSRALQVDAVSLYLQDEKGDYLLAVSTIEVLSEEKKTVRVEGDRAFFSWLERQEKGVELEEMEHESRNNPILPSARRYFSQVGAKVAFPLAHERSLIGIIHLGEKKGGKPFTHSDMALLSGFRPRAAIALANALAYQGVHRISQELEYQVAERTRELAESKGEVERSYRKLQELDRLKSEFFANVSHELRTPLTLILAPLELFLARPDLSADRRKEIEMVYQNGLRLLKLINNLLDLAKIDAGEAKLSYTRTDLGVFIEEIVSSVRPTAERKEITLAVSIHKSPLDGPLEFYFDRDRIEQVLLNLIFNGLKFTERGGRVEVACRRCEGAVVVSVSDSGIGIAKEDLPKIFGRFAQVDSSASRRHGGTGIGLALVKELIALHGGEIRAESEPGKGTVMTFTLPYRTGYPAVAEFPEKPEADWTLNLWKRAEHTVSGAPGDLPHNLPSPALNAAGQAKTILLVEDDPDMLQLLTLQLGEQYRIVTARNGVSGVERAIRDLPALILSDVMMPLKDGHQLCREIKADPRTRHLPVLLMTARADLSAKIEGLDCGADDYLTKPFSPEELAARVRSLLNLSEMKAQLVHSEKMAALGLLVAGVAHEVNNPLHFSKVNLKNLRRAVTPLLDGLKREEIRFDEETGEQIAEIPDDLRIIEEGMERIEKIVHDLKRYVRKEEEQFVPADLHAGLDSTLSLINGTLKGKVRIIKEYGEIGRVDLIPGQINQLFMNLLQNAIQAIPKGVEGTIRIKSWAEKSEADEKKWVKVSIRDNGSGIPPDHLGRIFDPFFTTKEVGEGTGLGLWVCNQIVTRHGGRIEVSSAPGKGTEMIVVFPVCREESVLSAVGALQLQDERK